MNFKEIIPNNNYSLEELKIKFLNYINKNRLNSNLSKEYFIKKNKLLPYFETLYYYTNFLDKKANYIERLYCIFNNIKEQPKCIVCSKIVRFYKGFISGYYSKFCSYNCNGKINNPHHSCLTNKQIDLIHKKIGNKLKGRKIDWLIYSDEKKKEIVRKRSKTNIKKYGFANAGILGAYSSKSAELFIRNYILENNINENKCYFKNGGINNKEFFQMIKINEKFRYFSYDLVIFKTEIDAINKNLNNIELILEYNGPWHYLETEVMYLGHLPATPYKNNKNTKTISETYNLDYIKKEHMLKYTKNYLIYWEKLKCFY